MGGFDATVVGSGPNGLSAAVELARGGLRVLVVEAADTIGGGTRTEELTLPGFLHDVCSAIHPSGIASPFFAQIGLDIEWAQPPIPVSHPLDGGRAVALHRSVDETAGALGEDASRYRRVMGPLVEHIGDLLADVLGPMPLPPGHPAAFARIALFGGMPATWLASRLATVEAKALLGGLAAHSIAPLGRLATSAVGLMLGAVGHSHGWPVARGGSRTITQALASQLEGLGGEIEVGRRVTNLEGLPGDLVMLDVMPPAGREITGIRPRTLAQRRWRPGPGVFKVDWALDGPIPWADTLSPSAGTVHLGGTFEEVRDSEAAVYRGEHPERPFVLLAQQSLFDDTRAPSGKHTAWAYCHVPNGSNVDMTAAIEGQMERFAPGFRDLVLGRSTIGPTGYQGRNPNLAGGDIGGGEYGPGKVLQFGRRRPYRLSDRVYLCSSATPPGAGAHGMCGYHAARAALADRGSGSE